MATRANAFLQRETKSAGRMMATRTRMRVRPRIARRTDVDLELVMENDQLGSTREQVWLVSGAIASLAVVLAKGCASTSGVEDVVLGMGAAATGYLAADLLSGIYHWGIDNYGDARTPLFGDQIAGFQGHHQRPWTITKREFCNNVHGIAKPVLLWSALFMALPGNCGLDSFAAVGGLFVLLSQELHKYAHMKKSELHPWIVMLQDSGVLISRKAHGQHHSAPFENNYCIVSGAFNQLLDNSQVFYKVEKIIHEWTGTEPRCWSEPNDDWMEVADE